MAATTHPPRVLLVGPSASWLEDLRARCRGLAEAREVSMVPDAAAARSALASRTFDAVAMSLAVDEDTATAVVAEIERTRSGVPLVGIAHAVDDTVLARACLLGITAIVADPMSFGELLDAARIPASDVGYSGSCTGVPTVQLLTLHCASGGDGVLHLRCSPRGPRPERSGSIFVEAGQPVHAATSAGTRGADAVRSMLGWVDAEASWLPGKLRPPRTIVGRWEGLLARSMLSPQDPANDDLDQRVAAAFPDVVEKVSRLAHTPDVLGAFLLRHAEVVSGVCAPELDQRLAHASLHRLAHVVFDVGAMDASQAGREIQATVGSMRVVVDRIGPAEACFQVGVFVRQAAPVCKSLRRLLRQIDTAFERAVRRSPRAERAASSSRATVEQQVA